MEKQRGVKTLSIVALLIAIVGLTVAFAAMNRTLTINSTTATVKSWNIHFEHFDSSNSTKLAFYSGNSNVTDNTNYTGEIRLEDSQPALSFGDALIQNISVRFNETGNTAYYTFRIVNSGSTMAKITNTNGAYDFCNPGTTTSAVLSGKLSCDLYFGNASSGEPSSNERKAFADGDVLAAGRAYYAYLKISLADPSDNTVLTDDATFTGITARTDFEQTSTGTPVTIGLISNS